MRSAPERSVDVMSNKSRRKTPQPLPAAAPAVRGFALLLIAGPIVGLALGIWLLGSVWPVDDDVETAYIYGGVGGFFSGLLGAAAFAGSLVMARGLATRVLSPVAGLAFGVGFIGLVLASMGSESAPWMLIGVTAIAACVIWFYVIGMIGGFIPPLFLNQYGTWVAPIGGVALIAFAVANDSLEGLVIGILTIAAWIGIVIGSALMSRRSSEQATR